MRRAPVDGPGGSRRRRAVRARALDDAGPTTLAPRSCPRARPCPPRRAHAARPAGTAAGGPDRRRRGATPPTGLALSVELGLPGDDLLGRNALGRRGRPPPTPPWQQALGEARRHQARHHPCRRGGPGAFAAESEGRPLAATSSSASAKLRTAASQATGPVSQAAPASGPCGSNPRRRRRRERDHLRGEREDPGQRRPEQGGLFAWGRGALGRRAGPVGERGDGVTIVGRGSPPPGAGAGGGRSSRVGRSGGEIHGGERSRRAGWKGERTRPRRGGSRSWTVASGHVLGSRAPP